MARLSSPPRVLGLESSTISRTVSRSLSLRERTKTDDNELMSRAWEAANDKARELAWIV